MAIINESGLYSLILRSRKPERTANRLHRTLTEEKTTVPIRHSG